MVLLEPGQDLEGEAQRLLFLSHGAGNAGEEEQIASKEDEIEDLNLLGMVEGAVGHHHHPPSGAGVLLSFGP